jgi:hypothetical protein
MEVIEGAGHLPRIHTMPITLQNGRAAKKVLGLTDDLRRRRGDRSEGSPFSC